MFDDGLHGDGLSADGEFGATIPAFPANTIVEFYVRVTDGTNVRTWPAPTATDGTQGANCLYLVETPENPGTRPFYRFVMTGQDEIDFRFDNWPSGSDAALNTTFIAQQGQRSMSVTAPRFASEAPPAATAVRATGGSIFRTTNDWQNRVAINPQHAVHLQPAPRQPPHGTRRLAREDATVVQVRLNGSTTRWTIKTTGASDTISISSR
jgi:hypothetical protein